MLSEGRATPKRSTAVNIGDDVSLRQVFKLEFIETVPALTWQLASGLFNASDTPSTAADSIPRSTHKDAPVGESHSGRKFPNEDSAFGRSELALSSPSDSQI